MIGIHSNIVDLKQASIMDTSSNCTGDSVSAAQALTEQVADLQAELLTAQTQVQQKEHERAELAHKLAACMKLVHVCPITQEPTRDPILCTVDGRVYEKTAFDQWLRRSSTSPMTRAPIDCSLSHTLVKYTPKDISDTINGFQRYSKRAKMSAGYTVSDELLQMHAQLLSDPMKNLEEELTRQQELLRHQTILSNVLERALALSTI